MTTSSNCNRTGCFCPYSAIPCDQHDAKSCESEGPWLQTVYEKRKVQSADASDDDDFGSDRLEENVPGSAEPPSSTPMTRELRNLQLNPTSKFRPAHARLETVLPGQNLSSIEQ